MNKFNPITPMAAGMFRASARQRLRWFVKSYVKAEYYKDHRLRLDEGFD